MPDYIVNMAIPGVALISGLIGTYVGLQNRALLADVRRELAELENRIITRINGTYVRTRECLLREETMQAKVATLIAERHGGKHYEDC
ncbi:MAG: hypothetical protein KIT09_31765 [Bryobacteraceae bacterium]|nr:hypothetical protein [Bryobacteraceae bacterium]